MFFKSIWIILTDPRRGIFEVTFTRTRDNQRQQNHLSHQNETLKEHQLKMRIDCEDV